MSEYLRCDACGFATVESTSLECRLCSAEDLVAEQQKALTEIRDAVRKPNGVITVEWYAGAVSKAWWLANDALAAVSDRTEETA